MGRRILCVDDEKDWRAVVEITLRDAGYHVVTAADATDAMDRIENFRPDLLILDLNLAGENGLMLMKFLRGNNPDLKVMIYTGLQQDGETIMRTLEQGVHSYLTKGPPGDLLREVERILQ